MLQLEGIYYRPVPDLPAQERHGSGQANAIVGGLIGAEIAHTLAVQGNPAVDFTLCVSTVMDMPFVSGYLDWREIASHIGKQTPVVPQIFTASYECAGWGFGLDYARRRLPQGGRVLIVVVDLNVLDISFWRENDNWGKSGFGISTVLLTLPAADDLALSVNVARSNQGMGEFCADLRKWLKASPAGLANVPFLPAEMVGIYGHFLPPERLMQDLHATWGHCFGSDTWISFIDAHARKDIGPGSVYCATSASLRGYWAMTDVILSNSFNAEFRTPITHSKTGEAA